MLHGHRVGAVETRASLGLLQNREGVTFDAQRFGLGDLQLVRLEDARRTVPRRLTRSATHARREECYPEQSQR
ncbi:MAG TPA: hypothetical protein P5055_19500, partial [Candidatus Paceibacterota bacterium]|nr:hypothetical protein [Candidatus Paceibacterota bacterium]